MKTEYTASRLTPYPVVLDSCVIFPIFADKIQRYYDNIF